MMLVWLCGFMSFTLAEKMESSIQDALYRFEMKGEFKKAIAILENVISEGDNEDKEKASFYLGKIQELAGNRQSANLYYKQSLQRTSTTSKAYWLAERIAATAGTPETIQKNSLQLKSPLRKVFEGNPAYFEDGRYELCADGIYVDGGRNIEIYNNFIFNCDIGLEVATEHSPDDDEHFKVSDVRVHDNVIADCRGWTGLCFGGYDGDLGFTEDCEFDHNTIADNTCQIAVQRSRNNRIHSNLILGGETGVEFSEECDPDDMINDISGNAAAGIMDEESWSDEYGKLYHERSEISDGFRSLIDDIGSRFVPDGDIMKTYENVQAQLRNTAAG